MNNVKIVERISKVQRAVFKVVKTSSKRRQRIPLYFILKTIIQLQV